MSLDVISFFSVLYMGNLRVIKPSKSSLDINIISQYVTNSIFIIVYVGIRLK